MTTQKKYTIQDKITNQANQPLPSLTIKAIDWSSNSGDKSLGMPLQTDAGGKYAITQTHPGSTDLVVQVYDAEEHQPPS